MHACHMQDILRIFSFHNLQMPKKAENLMYANNYK